MTYDEILRLLQSSGGTMQQADPYSYGGAAQSQAVALPDGRTAFSLDDGSIVVAQRTPDGQFNDIQTWAPGANAPVESRERFEPGRNFRRSLTGLAGILSLPLGVSALQSAGLLGAGGAAAAPAVAGGTTLEAALAGLPAVGEGMSLEAAAAALGAPGAAAGGATTGAATAGGAGAAAGTAAAGSTLSQVAQQLGLPATGEVMDFLRSNGSWLIPALGAGAAIAGNDDITSSQTQTGTSSGSANTTGGQTGTTSTQSTQGLAPWLQGYAQDFVGRAQQLANAPTSNQYLDQAGGLLMGATDDPLVQAARAQQQNVIGGGLLNSNPYIDQVAQGIGQRMGDAYAVGTRANTASRFNNDGNSVGAKSAYGQTNFMNDRAFGDSLGQTMSGLYANNYNTERAAQDAASRNSLAFGGFNQQAANNLSNFGQQDWLRPILQNQAYGQAINPAFGSQSTGTGNTSANTWQNVLTNNQTNQQNNQTVTAPNNWMAGLGGAATGAAIWNMFNPMRRP